MNISSLQKAASILLDGGVVAYPTEGVYGIGCIPDYGEAVERCIAIKQRRADAGLILIAADYEQFTGWIAPHENEAKQMQQRFDHPVTWVVTAAAGTPDYLTGGRPTLAVRITNHPVVTDLCRATGSALVSTSANRSGHPAAKSALLARKWLGGELDMVVPGKLGDASGPSEIRVAKDNAVLRPYSDPLRSS